MKSKLLKRTLVAISILIALFAVIGLAMAFFLSRGLAETQALKIRPVTAGSLADGTYAGQYGDGRWANQLDVTVKDGRITAIQIRKTVQFEKPEVTRELISRVVAAQKADVDVVSGATATCKAYLKSIEAALAKP